MGPLELHRRYTHYAIGREGAWMGATKHATGRMDATVMAVYVPVETTPLFLSRNITNYRKPL